MNLDGILKQFGIEGSAVVEPIDVGLLHKTYLATVGEAAFIVQKLHDVIKREALGDARVVTDFARGAGISVPTYLTTQDNLPYVLEDGALWRVMEKLPGQTHQVVTDPVQAKSAAALLGDFHVALRNSDYRCVGSIPHFHDTPYIYEQFKKVIAAEKGSEKFQRVAVEVEFVLKEVPTQFLPDGLPQQLVHGDLKISNFLFDGNSATSILDFDTTMNHTLLVDIGDAMRSWTNSVGEDTPNAVFDRAVYEAAKEGYVSTANLSDRERDLIPQAFRLMTIECGMRFLKDYFEDSYFGWDPENFASRVQHNLIRARGQFSLYSQSLDL